VEIETVRMRLRRWRPEDVDSLARIYDDPEVVRYLFPMDGREAVRRQIEGFERQWDERGLGKWAAEDRATGALIGRIGFFHHDDFDAAPGLPEVGWTLARAHWGRGLATEGGKASLELAFGKLGVERVISIIAPQNVSSRRVAEKLGLALRGDTTWRGVPVVWYGVERDAWERLERR
jgi:RimJ/RimL family protein N-acetyltransferase